MRTTLLWQSKNSFVTDGFEKKYTFRESFIKGRVIYRLITSGATNRSERQLVVWCVRVRACVCLRPSTVKASSVWIRLDTRKQINDVMLKTLNSYTDSLHRYFRMQNLTFLLAALSCLHTRSKHSHDVTSVRLAFRTWGLHSPFSRRRLRYALHRELIYFQTWHSQEGSQSI